MSAHFSHIKNSLFNYKTAKPLAITKVSLKKANFIYQREIFSTGNKVKNLNYLLYFINFQIYFLLITWKSIIFIMKSRKIWFSPY